MKSAHEFQVHCSICNKPVDIETSTADEKGKTVHRECYAIQLLTKPPRSNPTDTSARIKAS